MDEPLADRSAVRLGQFSRRAAFAVISLGGVGLLGWILHEPSLTRIVPGLATMKANTAVALVLSGFALLASREPGPTARLAGASCAAVVALVGSLTLAQHFWGIDLSIDELLFRDPATPPSSEPGRMAAATALALTLSGLALLLLHAVPQALPALSQLLALGTAGLGLLALSGYTYEVAALYHVDSFSTMAIHTALALLILGLGTVCARPDRGLMAAVSARGVGRLMLRRLLPVALAIPFVFGQLTLTGQRLGLYDPTFGTALFTIATILTLTAFIAWEAGHLQRLDSARGLAEAYLRTSERSFRLLFADHPFPMWVYDLDTLAFLDVNEAAVAKYGYGRDEFLRMRITDIRPEEDVPRLLADVRQRRRRFQSSGEWRHRLKSGRVIDVSVASHTVPFAGRSAVLVVAEDVTERKRAEAALRESERLLATLMANLPGAAYRCRNDAERTMEFISEGCLELMGCSPAEFLSGRVRFVDLVHPDDRAQMEDEIQSAALSGAVYHTTYRIRDLTGRERWVWDQGRAVLEPDGSVGALEGLIADVTERKLAEEVLRNQQRWLEELLDLTPSPILLVERAGARVIFANRASEALTAGLRPMREVVDGAEADFYFTDSHGSRVPPNRQPVARVAQGERLEGLPLDWHTPAGTSSLLAFADVLPAMAGHATTAILVLQDVTGLKRIEAELRAAHRLKDEFLATLSHELRTPLSPIVGWAKMMRAGQLDEATTALAVDAILRNAALQARLVDDLLDISAIVSGKLRLRLQPLDPGELVAQAVAAVQPMASAKRIDIQVAIAPDAPQVPGDADRLQQVVWNLLSNAVKFTPSGGRVDVSIEVVDEGVELVVRDTGEGIAPEVLPHVFERFRQADSSTTRRHGGLGLGLAIVRHLVEMHGGTVEVTSAGRGQGALFRVRLPALPRVRSTVPPGPEGQTREEARSALAGVRVLAVDDQRDALELITTVLARAGAEVRPAASGAAALVELETWSPDVLVADIGMPAMDGYEMLARVRALGSEVPGPVPALAVTAFAAEADRRRLLARGFQDHLPKPLDPAELIRRVARLAGRSRHEATA